MANHMGTIHEFFGIRHIFKLKSNGYYTLSRENHLIFVRKLYELPLLPFVKVFGESRFIVDDGIPVTVSGPNPSCRKPAVLLFSG